MVLALPDCVTCRESSLTFALLPRLEESSPGAPHLAQLGCNGIRLISSREVSVGASPTRPDTSMKTCTSAACPRCSCKRQLWNRHVSCSSLTSWLTARLLARRCLVLLYKISEGRKFRRRSASLELAVILLKPGPRCLEGQSARRCSALTPRSRLMVKAGWMLQKRPRGWLSTWDPSCLPTSVSRQALQQ